MARSSNTRQKTAKANMPEALGGTDAFDSPAPPALTGDALPPEALAQVLTAEDVYISPQTLAAMTGLDEKWFAGAREGHKEVDGPPFRKLGTAKSAPIRYNLADVRKWWAQFPKQVTTHGKLSAFRSAGEFFKAASPSSRWLFANVAGEPVDIVLAFRSGVFEQATREPEVFWLTFPEWIARAWQSERLNREISARLRTLQEAALADYEQRSFEIEVRQAPSLKPPRLDDPRSAEAGEEPSLSREPELRQRL